MRYVCARLDVDDFPLRLQGRARSIIHGAAALIFCLWGTGCTSRDDLIVWKVDAPSPDGRWLATADTVQNGGFGSGDIFTTVHLRNTQGPIPHPYVLDNVANQGGSINLTMAWAGPSRLNIGYTSKAGTVVSLQMLKYAGIDIFVVASVEKSNVDDGPS
jgi:hypothetical protein